MAKPRVVSATRPLGLAGSVWALFAIFCFVLELEQMGRPRLERKDAPR